MDVTGLVHGNQEPNAVSNSIVDSGPEAPFQETPQISKMVNMENEIRILTLLNLEILQNFDYCNHIFRTMLQALHLIRLKEIMKQDYLWW